MSIIKEMKALRAENATLKAKIREMETDISSFSTKVGDFFAMLGFKRKETTEDDNDGKIDVMNIAKNLLRVGKDFMFGKIKKEYIESQWKDVQDILEKYDNLIMKEENV